MEAVDGLGEDSKPERAPESTPILRDSKIELRCTVNATLKPKKRCLR